jgi:GNAT superfamily N-acetyltransferase
VKIVELEGDNEKLFWKSVNKDPFDYYFFILDWKKHREETRILMAVDGEKVCGLMLIFANKFVQLRGETEAIETLLTQLNLEKAQITAPIGSEQTVLNKYPKPQIQERLLLMWLAKIEKNLKTIVDPDDLGPQDAAEIAEIMRKTNPNWWGDTTALEIESSFQSSFWVGVRQNRKLVSIGEGRCTEVGGHIVIAATDERFRSRGYATSIVLTLAKRLLKTAAIVLIFVLSENAAAVGSYKRVGFKPYRSYFVLKT